MTAPWTKLPALPARNNPCLLCDPIGAKLSLDSVIAVGFGDAHVSRDGVIVYQEPSAYHGQKPCDCEFFGYVDAACTVLCGRCGGESMIDDPDAGEPDYWDVARAEELASNDPDHDWRITLFAPLHGEVYQRHGPGEWMLIEKSEGFA